MKMRSDSFSDQQPIPSEYAFGRTGDHGEPMVWSGNRNPHLAWSDAPPATRSFVLMCVDADVPSRFDDANQPGRRVAAELPRVEFVHWLMIDLPPECRELAAGSCSDGVVEHGKREPLGPPGTRQARNGYSVVGADGAVSEPWYGYDGPCPPWNDERIHHYDFTIYALDVATLVVPAQFTLADVREAMTGHVLAEAGLTGTYTLNPTLR